MGASKRAPPGNRPLRELFRLHDEICRVRFVTRYAPNDLLPELVCFCIMNSKNITPLRTTKKQCAGTVFLNVVLPAGIEPATFSLKGSCSTG